MRTTTSASAFDHIPESVRLFLSRRCAEACGAALLVGLVAMGVALMTWSVQDPSLNHATATPVHNWLRGPGAVASDLVMQLFGLSAIAIMMPLAFWGWTLVTTRRLARIGMAPRAPLPRGALRSGRRGAAAGVGALAAAERSRWRRGRCRHGIAAPSDGRHQAGPRRSRSCHGGRRDSPAERVRRRPRAHAISMTTTRSRNSAGAPPP